jgi:class 3 adenylate cyclase/tetratricopeptide (TPR) repeat protein
MTDATHGLPAAGGLPTGTVTFLFTDVVGSTALWEQAPQTMGPAMELHDALIETAVADHDGQVVRPRGEGDSRFAVFSRASAAAAAAIAVMDALHQEQWSTPSPIRVRLAIHTGEAGVRDGDYYGSAVNRCARLRSLAYPGQILVSQASAVLVLGAPPQGATLADLGEHTLRDMRRPERVFQLCHPSLPNEFPPLAAPVAEPDSLAEGRVPIPSALLGRPDADALDLFVGRDADIARLLERLEKLREGPAELVMVSGEAGIGKSELCAEVARLAHAAETTVLYGRCDEDLGVPYQPWIEALTHLVRAAPHAVTRRDAGELAGLLPAVREAVPGVGTSTARDPETERYLLFGAVTSLLAAASAVAPVVIVLDDLHWADKSTLSLLRHLVASPVPMRVLVLATYRDSDLSRGDALRDALASLWRAPGVERLALGGLDDPAVLAMLEGAGYGLDDDVADLAQALRRDTDGNPFFAREIVRHLAETGAISRDDQGRWHAHSDLAETRLPASVREVVGQRVARLGEDAQRVLATAAVVGRDFDLDLVARLADCSDDDVLDVLDEAIAAAVIEEVPGRVERFTFAHALIQRTLYEDLGQARRGRFHRRVAEALEEVCGADGGDRVGELARHWAAATAPVQAGKAIDYARLAGDRALDALAPDEAIRWYTQALELLGSDAGTDTTRCDLLIGLGTAQLRVGDTAHRQTLLDAAALARRTDDTDRLVAAALANYRGWQASAGEVDTQRVEVLTTALDALDATDTTRRARLLATSAVELAYSGDLERITALADEAVALARRIDDEATLVHALNSHHQALRLPETLAARLGTAREAVALADRLGDPRPQFTAHQQLVQAAVEAGDRVARDRNIMACHEIATRIHEPYLRWVDAQNRATQVLLDGDPDRAEILAEETFAIGTESGQPDALMVYGVQLLDVRIHQGRCGELADLVAAGIRDNPGLPSLYAAVARAYIDADRLDEARALLDDGVNLPHDDLWLVGTSMWAQVAARVGALATAALLFDHLAPWAGQIPSAVVVAMEPIDHCLGELGAALGRVDRAHAHFAAAEATARRFGAPFFVARTLLERARLEAEHDPEAAQARVAEALTIATSHGYARLERVAAGLLVSS